MKLVRENGVNANLVCKWLRKHTQPLASPPSSTLSFIPVQISATSDEFEFGEKLPRKAERTRTDVLSSVGERVTAERREAYVGMR